MTHYVPVEPIPPGEILQGELDARGWTQDDFAEVIGMSRRQIINLMAGKAALTPETAIKIGKALDHPPKFWMDLQVSYELAVAAQNERKESDDIARRSKVFGKVPVRDLERRGWIGIAEGSQKSAVALERIVCEFLQVKSIEDTPQFAAAARKSASYTEETPSQLAWRAQTYRLAEHVHAEPFDPTRFDDGLLKLRDLAASAEDVRRVPKVLADIGVRMVIVERLPKSNMDGLAFWVEDKYPAVALSVRYDRIDNFWFTLMHECMHIRFNDRPPIDEDLLSAAAKRDERPEMEKRADDAAANLLVPKERLESFIMRARPLYYRKRIMEFAGARGVHPGIVVGQLQCRGELTYAQYRQLLVKVREHIIGAALTDGWGECPIPPVT